MLINEVTNAGAMPVLAQVMSFAAQRQRLLAHNIANATTPGFAPKDVSPVSFQKALGEAIDSRRAQNGGLHGAISLPETPELKKREGGGFELNPSSESGNILFHDQNSRSLERMMQALAENNGVFAAASTLMRQQGSQILSAIRETA